MTQNETLPFDEMSEKACLGAMLIDNRYINDVFSIIDIDDFYKDGHKEIAKAIIELTDKKKRADTVTISSCLREKKELKFIGGYDYINGLVDGIPENISVSEYAEKVKKESEKREIFKATQRAGAESLKLQNEPDEIVNQLNADILKITDRSYSPELTLDQRIDKKFTEDLKREPENPKGYILKNYPQLTKAVDGIQAGFYIIGAESNIGKTAILVNLFLDLLKSNPEIRCLYFTLDDSINKILNRLYSNISGIELMDIDKRQGDNTSFQIDGKKIKAGDLQRQTVEKVKKYFLDKRLDVIERFKIIEVRRIIERSLAINKNTVIFIDGFHYLDVGNFQGNERDERQAEIIKRIVSNYDIPIITTAEVRKDKDQKYKNGKSKERRLTISDISGSKRLVYRADLVLLLEPENENDFFDSDQKEPILKVSFAKNKLSYFKGEYRLKFQKYTTRMTEFNRTLENEIEESEDYGSRDRIG